MVSRRARSWGSLTLAMSYPIPSNPWIKLSGGPVQVDYYEDTVKQQFNSAAGFFRHIKKLGAGTQQEGRHLSPERIEAAYQPLG
ncbi:MAG: hypothetical protein U5K69_19485 [Balneolaceae bacterium]|nr:hypothetical protein [Balneolaceae bacterium]